MKLTARTSANRRIARFEDRVEAVGGELRADGIRTLQVSLGFRCNMACSHCHLSAGMHRPEVMASATAERLLGVVEEHPIPRIEFTGGAPELHPFLKRLVARCRELGREVAVRTNLTVMEESGLRELPEFFASHGVELFASLPCYMPENVDRQRGHTAFERSIRVMRRLNDLGYGRGEDGPRLHLVHNPGGEGLPPAQEELEEAYRRELGRRFGVCFDRLFVLTNAPIGRFAVALRSRGRLQEYLERLADSFNAETVSGLMCRNTLSVGWDGLLYDCDFNQALELPLADGIPGRLAEFDHDRLARRPIRSGLHCYTCTAGSGSSCRGALV